MTIPDDAVTFTVRPVPAPPLVVDSPAAVKYPVPPIVTAPRVATTFSGEADVIVTVALFAGVAPFRLAPRIVTVSLFTYPEPGVVTVTLYPGLLDMLNCAPDPDPEVALCVSAV